MCVQLCVQVILTETPATELLAPDLWIYFLVCDASLHPSDPFSDVRSDQTLQDLAYMIVPKLFQRECERRKEFCKKNKIEYRMPKFKTKQGYIPGNIFCYN